MESTESANRKSTSDFDTRKQEGIDQDAIEHSDLSPDEFLVGRDSRVTPVLSVVLPTKNEEAGIPECITAIKHAIREMQVTTEIIVSDNSTDQTPDIARDHGAIVVHPPQAGYGNAYRYAFEHARGQYIVMGDADTTYDFTAIPALLSHLIDTDADMVLGSRLAGEIEPGAMPALHRYIGNPLLTLFLNLFYDTDVTDAHSGFRVLTRDALNAMALRTEGMEFASEMVMVAGAQDLQIEEVPIEYSEREGDATLDSVQDGWRHIKFMLMNAPGYIFSVPAIGSLVLSVIMMGLSLWGGSVAGITFGTHTMIIGSLLTIVGYQIGSLAVFSALATTPIRSPSDPITDWIRTNIKFEQGAILGIGLFTAGAGYLTFVAWRWLTTGIVGFDFIVWNLLAFTLVVLGVQTVFYSLFLSMLGQQRNPSHAGAGTER